MLLHDDQIIGGARWRLWGWFDFVDIGNPVRRFSWRECMN
jgi:hypothetical protein